MRKRIAKQEVLWYEEELRKEINEDRKEHGKKPLKDKDNQNQTNDNRKVKKKRRKE
jgi:hypothetical protein